MYKKVTAKQSERIYRRLGLDCVTDDKLFYATDLDETKIFEFETRRKRDKFIEQHNQMCLTERKNKMQKLTWAEFENIMFQHNVDSNINVKGQDKHPLIGVIVYKQGDYFKKEYNEIERSYRVSSDNKWFIPGQIGRSIFATCLDGTDINIRLDYCPDWVVDYCYIEGDENDDTENT